MKRRLSCVDFLTRLYGLRLTLGQRTFVRVAIDRVPLDQLTSDERRVAETMFGAFDSVPPAVAWLTVVLCCGRASGKTEICAGIALWLALVADVSKCGPGDLPRAFVVAPDVETARLSVRRALARVEASEELADLLEGQPGADGFDLRRPDGTLVRFECRAASRGGATIRGRSILALILDECAFVPGEGYAVDAAEIVRAARPRLLPGALVMLSSTPWASEGLFHDLFASNFGQPSTAIAAWGPTLVMRDNDPQLAEAVAAERLLDPDAAEREFDARFNLGGSSSFFDPAALEASTVEIDPTRYETKGAGADIGLVRDSSALVIAGRRDIGDAFELAFLDFVEMRPTKTEPLKLSRVVETFAERMRAHDVSSVLADGHAREPAREYAQQHGITIEAAPAGNAGKFETFELVRRLLKEGRLFLPNNARLAAQLRAIRAKPLPSGGFQIVSPRSTGGGHGDIVSAAVLACWILRHASSFVPTITLRDLVNQTRSRTVHAVGGRSQRLV